MTFKEIYKYWNGLSIPVNSSTGRMRIYPDSIRISAKELNLNIPVSEIEHLAFTNNGYDGESYVESSWSSLFPLHYNGKNNYLSFTWKKQEYKFEMYISHKSHQLYLFRWIKYCQKKGIDANVNNETQQLLPVNKNGKWNPGVLGLIGAAIAFFIWIRINKEEEKIPITNPGTEAAYEYNLKKPEIPFSEIISIKMDTSNTLALLISVPFSLKKDTANLHYVATRMSHEAGKIYPGKKIVVSFCPDSDEKEIIKKYEFNGK